MNHIEFYKSLKTKEEVFNELKKVKYSDFEKEFEELDQTQKNVTNSSYTFSNKELAKIFLEFAKNNIHNNMYAKLKENFAMYLNKTSDNKFVFDIKAIEQSFVNKDEDYIQDMFKIKARLQLSQIIYDARNQEIKNLKTKANSYYVAYLKFLNDFTYKYKKKFISTTYKIAKRKVQELRLLFSTNDYTFHIKSHNKNATTFIEEKNAVSQKIKKELNEIKNLDPITKAKRTSEIYQQGIEYNYDWEVASLNAKAKEKFLIKKQQIDSDFIDKINKAKQDYVEILKNKKQHDELTKKVIIQANEDFKTQLEFATTKSEKKNLKLEHKQNIKEIKSDNAVKKAKDNWKNLKHNYKVEKNKNRLEYTSEIENIKNNLPIEYPVWKQVLSIIFGWIPGVGPLINGQYKKAIVMFLTLPLFAIFGAYAFGIGNVGGNGLLGLIDFGADNPDGDGRFYLIEGIISLIIAFWICISIFSTWMDSKNNAKKMRIGSRASTFSQTRKFLKSHGIPYILSIPAIIGIMFIVLVPIISTILIAFTNYGKGNDPGRPGQIIKWVGFDNFKSIFGGEYFPSFLYVIGWTFAWVIATTISVIVVGSLFALLVNNERLKGKRIFRLIYILPWAVPAFIMIMVFAILLSSIEFNNFTYKWIGVSGWTSQQTQARIVLILLQTWLGHSYMFLLITGVLQGISKDLYYSSTIDGASKWKQLTRITLPLILTQVAPLLVGQFVFNFGNFGIIYLFGANPQALNAKGEPYPGQPGITDILISFVFKLSTHPDRYTYGIAASFIIVSSFIVVGTSANGFRKMKAFKN
ncbi:Maltosaccharide ABC superfamily ATP binding cassette transporter, permease protein [Mycoplasma leachii 99/014/6]|uniref:carbohydrate ABC transporter permease n=1 Tax=Mycoplasma leachii TaxID=2105 RepID=UPI00021770BC|nr:sugar ABC transporter permease [Mycoplasma leachii]CBV67161.1 Maltosaccharide ABC superfamily ATP binding cassette transporter, permease protein [Mycoplasma leachii 99/014/6]